MRKLTKKISMLMVLAMLVGLFSGVVSASAASKWSFKSGKYDVAVGGEINMQKDEFADFDLLKDGKAPEDYTVTWASSDEDVVWVNAESGKLRADKFGKAEDGDKAVISATFTNETTGKSATRSFTIVVGEVVAPVFTVECADVTVKLGEEVKFNTVVKNEAGEVVKFAEHKSHNGYFLDGKAITNPWTPEEAGEYTVIAAQFAAKADKTDLSKAVRQDEVKVVVTYDGILSAKQSTFNSVAITCGSADGAATIVENVKDLAVAYILGDNKIAAFVKSAKVDEKDATIVNVELLNNLIKDTTYTFTYGEDTVSVVGADLNQYHSIAVNTPSVPKGEAAEIEILFYNANGVVVDKKKTGFTIKADLSNDYAIVDGEKLFFYSAGKSATITVTYYMGFDNQGNKIEDLTTTATVSSFDKSAMTSSAITSWTIDGNNYGEGNFKIAVTDATKTLGFKYTVYNVYNQPTEKTKNDPIPSDLSFVGFAYTSTNDKVVMVDANGTVYPVGAGSAQIIVETIDKNDPNKKTVVGVCTFTVDANRKLTSMNPTANKSVLSSAVVDSIRIKPDAKDQLGSGFAPAYNIKLANSLGTDVELYVVQGDDDRKGGETDDVKLVYSANTDGVPVEITGTDNGAPYFDIYATKAAGYAKNAQLAITATQGYPYSKLTGFVIVQVKAPAAVAYYNLDGLADSIDMNILARPGWASDTWYFKTDIKLNGYDNGNYFVASPELKKGAGAAAENDFYYTVTKGNEDVTNLMVGNTFQVVAASGSTQLVKFSKGTGVYTVTVYQKLAETDRFITAKNIVINDTSVGLTVDQTANKITPAESDEKAKVVDVLNKSLKLKREGKDANNASIIDAEYKVVSDKLYVTSVLVAESYDNFAGGKKLEMKVDVGAIFEIK